MSLPALLVAASLLAPVSTTVDTAAAKPAKPARQGRTTPAPAPAGASTSEFGPAHEPFPEVPPPPPSEHPLDITADHLTVLTKENKGIWKGHVHAVRAGENGQPPVHIKCDEMTTTTRQESKEKQTVDTVVCVGDVEVVQGDRAGWGEKAVFDNIKGFLVVTGHPHGQQGGNQFAGERLTFDVNSDRIEVEGHVQTHSEAQQGGGLPGSKP